MIRFDASVFYLVDTMPRLLVDNGFNRTKEHDSVGYTAGHLHQRISEHRYSARNNRGKIDHLFKVLRKCKSKFDCLVYEMLYIKDIKPSLNTQADSIRAKLFT